MYDKWSTVGPCRPWTTLCQHEDVGFSGAEVMGQLSWVLRTERWSLPEEQVLLSTEPSLQETNPKSNCYDILSLCFLSFLFPSGFHPISPGWLTILLSLPPEFWDYWCLPSCMEFVVCSAGRHRAISHVFAFYGQICQWLHELFLHCPFLSQSF